MSIFQADLIHASAFRVAIADMRKNQYLLEDAYSELVTDPFLKQLYGKKEIERFKAFILRDIEVFVEHRPPDQIKFPYLCISIGSAEEDAAKDALGDSYGTEQISPDVLGGARIESLVVLGPVTPIAYDSLTGVMTFGEGINLLASNIFDTQYVIDTVNNVSYPIQLVLDGSNLMIEPNSTPNLTNMVIQTTSKPLGTARRYLWMWRTDRFEIASSDANELMYLYTIVMYILVRYKKHLWGERNFEIATISHGPLQRLSREDDPNNVYSMEFSLRGRTSVDAIESVRPITQGLDFQLKIDGMQTPQAVLQQEGIPPLWDGSEDTE